MATLLPPTFLVQPVFEVDRLASWPDQADLELFESLTPLPSLASMDPGKPPLEVRMGWRTEGIAVAVRIGGKVEKPRAEPLHHEQDDRVVVGIDTRDTKSIQRAGRFCHRFHLTPCDEDGELDPSLSAALIPRATDDAPLASFAGDAIAAAATEDGYCVLGLLRAAALNGFDPEFSDRLGLHVEIGDRELGTVPLIGDPKMPNAANPSLWASVRLRDEAG